MYLLDKISSSKIDFTEEKHIAYILEKLVGDFMHPFYQDHSKVRAGTLTDTEQNTNQNKISIECIYRDIFLWCVLTYRLDMAKIFLSQMTTRICSALIASKILKAFIVYAPDQAAREELNKKADEFQTYAIDFVHCTYENDKHLACELVMRQIDVYGGVTCLQMAFVADNKRFLYEDTCHALLTNIWYDKVDPVQEQNKLILNLFTLGISQFFISMYERYYYNNYSKLKHKQQVFFLNSNSILH